MDLSLVQYSSLKAEGPLGSLNWLSFRVVVLQIALAIGIIAVISRELWHVTAYRTGSWRYNYVYGECFMQSNYGASKTK